MKSIMLSIQPKYCELIASGKKTIEVRKTAPYTRVKCYMYCTLSGCKEFAQEDLLRWGNGKWYAKKGNVIGEFVCNLITPLPESIIKTDLYDIADETKRIVADSGLTREELLRYMGDNVLLYGLHISDLKIYDKPKKLGEFRTPSKVPKKIHCSGCGYASTYMERCERPALTRPPATWCYVEELSE